MTDKQDIRYNFKEVEPRILKMWEDNGCFSSAVNAQGEVVDPSRAGAETYVIAIPPPNVTGRLHMGHALNNSIQDMIIRYKRMDGFDALWVPGTDHAGIATQTVVKKMLDAEGVDYHEMGRDKFVDKVWEWREKYGDIILKQLEGIGCSCDWDRTRFTMDEGLSKAVMHTFKALYDQGLIYRGKRIVNWCPVDRTALSDDEVETKEGGEPGFLWHIKYPLADESGHLVVATTRPETLFGDVAVAVNPNDERYSKYIGKDVIVPLQERVVKVIADEYVDMEFGTGCLKITPAHDANDFEVGQRHGLAPVNVMHENATMNDVVPERYQGLDRFKCRDKAVEELKEKELLVSEEPRMTPLGRSYRSKAIIEYRLSDQWFVKMKPLAEKVLEKHNELNIQPERWNKVYLHWVENIRDWCVSRQIWWGHRIPAWYCEGKEAGGRRKEAEEGACPPIVSITTPEVCPCCGSIDLVQETDVLDTWFSSALWPMSTLGWPEKTPDFERYFPTSTLVTAKDIIFFWVARMNIMAVHFTGQLPYKDVFINPTLLDAKGETMSKSKGNGIDPLIVINGATLEELEQPVREARPSNMKEILKRLEKDFPDGYQGVGADALRYTLIYLCSSGQQLRISLNSFHEIGLRFMTKLWNATRFILMNVEKEPKNEGDDTIFDDHLTPEDQWIRARLQIATNRIRKCLDEYDFTNLGKTFYQYVWNDFCDWYIELCKERLASKDDVVRKTALHNLIVVFAKSLIILNPLIPFVTEELYDKLLPLADAHGLWGAEKPKHKIAMMSPFPKAQEITAEQSEIMDRFERLQRFVSGIRTLRKTYMIKDAQKLKATAYPSDKRSHQFLTGANAIICKLANLEKLHVVEARESKPARSVTVIDPDFEIYLEIAEFIDVESEKKRLTKEIGKLEGHVQGLNKKLSNEKFLNNANPEVVAQQKGFYADAKEKLSKTKALLDDLASW